VAQQSQKQAQRVGEALRGEGGPAAERLAKQLEAIVSRVELYSSFR